MSKHLLKRFTPNQDNLRNSKHLQIFARWLHAPYLWHINRHSTARAFVIGLFITMLPVPIHMLLATGSAIIFRANLPIAIALVWVNNPLTMPPVFYFCYLLGAILLGRPVQAFDFSVPEEGLLASLGNSLLPLWIGCLIVGTILALVSYVAVHWLWRWYVIKRWRHRRAIRLAKVN